MSDGDDCPNISRCALFPLFRMGSVLEFWQTTYCRADYGRCKRFVAATSGVRPADTMLPNGSDLDPEMRASVETENQTDG